MFKSKNKTSFALRIARRAVASAKLVFFLVALTGVFLYTRAYTPTRVEAATSSTLNFQARLLTSGGGIVPDGKYNVEFKLYDVNTGGTELWTETYYDSNGAAAGNDTRVTVKGGYMSVQLGSNNSFPAINWDHDLWLTMNVGGSAQTATPTWDGEMNPRIKLTAVPYAFAAGQLAKYNGTQTGTLSFDTVANSPNILLPDIAGTNNVLLQSGTTLFTQGSIPFTDSNGRLTQDNTQFFWDDTDNQLGIGTNTPDASLDVLLSSASGSAGSLQGVEVDVTDTGVVASGIDNTYGQQISVTRTGATGGTINTTGLNINVTGDTGGISTVTGLNVNVSGADTNYAAIFMGGNIGVGVATPDATLDVDGTLDVTGLATFSGGITVTSGNQFTNAGSSLFTATSISDLPTGGALGTAAATVDAHTTFNVNQTTAGQTLTLPTPTDTTAGRIIYINNVGTANFTMSDVLITTGRSQGFIWTGSAWTGAGIDSAGNGVVAIGTLNSQTKSADGAVITNNNLYLQTADATYPGLVSTGVQEFAGAKTFNAEITAGAGIDLGAQTLQGTTAVIDFTNFDVDASGNTTVGGTLAVTGTSTFTGGATFNGGVTVASNSNFVQNGTGTFSTGTGAVTLNGNTSVSGTNTFTVGTGATSLGGTLSVTDASTFTGLATFNGGVAVANNSSFSQTGTGTFSTGTGAISLNGAVSVTGTNTLTVGTGATSLGGTLGVTGATTLSSTLAVTGTSTFTGGATFNGGVTVANNSSFSQTGTGTFSTGTGSVTLNGATSVSGTNTFTVGTGATTLGGTLDVTGAATLQSTLAVQGSGVTIGTTTQQGSLIVHDGAGNTATIQTVGAFGQDTVFYLPDVDAATATLCTSTGNCAGAGSSVTATTAGTAGRLAYFTANGRNIGDSVLIQGSGSLTLDSGNNFVVAGGDIDVTGDGVFSGNLTVDTSTLYVDAANDSVGIGTLGPDRKLDVLDATNPQLRLTQNDGTVYVDFQADSSGNLTIDGTGTKTVIADNLQIDGTDLTFNGAGTITSTGTNPITIDSGTTGDVNVGTGANAKSVTIGSTTGTATTTIQAGSGGLVLNTSTISRTATGQTTIDLVDTSDTTLAITNSGTGVAILSVDGDIYGAGGISLYQNAITDGYVEAIGFCTGDGESACITDFSSLQGSANIWTDGGTYAYTTNSETLGDSTSGGANKITGVYLADSAPIVFGADNDVTYSFSGTTLAVTTGANVINYDSDTLVVDGANNNIGIGDATPDAKLEVSSTTEQLRLTYTDGTVDSRFTVDASGNLTIDNTGTKTVIADDLQVNGTNLTFNGAGNITSTGATALSVDTGGAAALNLGTVNATSVLVGNATNTATLTLDATAGGTVNIANSADTHTVNIATGAAAQAVAIGSTNTTSSLTLNAGSGGITLNGLLAADTDSYAICRDASTGQLTHCDANTTGRPFLHTGNSFGEAAILGTNDAFDLNFETSDTVRMSLKANGDFVVDESDNTFFVDATNNRVGIGTGTPSTALEVNGDITLSEGGARTLQVETRTTNAAGNDLLLRAGNAGAGASALQGGNVNIIGGDAAGTGNANGGNVQLYGGNGVGTGTAGNVILAHDGTSTIGRVGVGTASPNARLHVVSSDGTLGFQVENTSTSGYATASVKSDAKDYRFGVGGSTEAFFGVANDFFLFDNSTGQMRFVVDTTGQFGLGDVNPDAKLEVLSTTEQLRLTHTDDTADSRFTVDASGNLTIDNTGTKTVIADDLQVNGTNLTFNGAGNVTTTGATALTVDTGGAAALNLGTTNATSVLLGNTANTATLTLDAAAGGTVNIANSADIHTVNIATGAAAQAVAIGSTDTTSSLTLNAGSGGITINGLLAADTDSYVICRDASTGQLTQCDTNTTGRPFLHNGNSFGEAAILGTNDAFDLNFETSDTIRMTLKANGDFAVDESDNTFFVDASNNRVGIGTGTPSARLDVVGANQATADTDAEDALNVTGGTGGVASVTGGGDGGAIQLTGGVGGAGTAGLAGGSGGDITLQGGAPGANNGGGTGTYGDLLLQLAGGSVGIGVAPTSNAKLIVQDGSNPVLVANATGSNDIMQLQSTGTTVFSVSSTGNVLGKATGDSTSAFEIQRGSNSASLFTVDTTNAKVLIGNGTPTLGSSTSGALYVTDTAEFAGRVLIGTATNGIDTGSGNLRFTGSFRNSESVTLAPEFAGATLTGDGSNNVGTMTSDFCSGTSKRSINTGVCVGATDEHNYYSWTANATNDYDVWLKWQVPSNFSDWDSTAFQFNNWRQGTTEAVTVTMYRADGSSCGSATIDSTDTTTSAWALSNLTTSCTPSAGEVLTIRVQLSVGTNGNFARIGEIYINYLAAF